MGCKVYRYYTTSAALLLKPALSDFFKKKAPVSVPNAFLLL